jgi:6-pyruvoyltetrahydropterin/6-carboxytetrahydropterin synthase
MMVYLTRRYRFSAGHRLHNEALSAEENRRVYGKCNNPNGHGHNYVLEVTVAGPVDPSAGMVYDLALLDGMVEREVLEPFDHKNLNVDVENFRQRVPTTENLSVEIFELLRRRLEDGDRGPRVRLAKVRLQETESIAVTYEGECEVHPGDQKGQ